MERKDVIYNATILLLKFVTVSYVGGFSLYSKRKLILKKYKATKGLISAPKHVFGVLSKWKMNVNA